MKLTVVVGAVTNMQFTYSFPTGFTFLYLVQLQAAEDERGTRKDGWRDWSRWKRVSVGLAFVSADNCRDCLVGRDRYCFSSGETLCCRWRLWRLLDLGFMGLDCRLRRRLTVLLRQVLDVLLRFDGGGFETAAGA